ncbi:MAG: class I SAM-dependent methyltransferase [Candidatus Omnitrophica bacterium]|nr:class I SAM-dependent methyltransferase [Candidatus Omnitrophota bacterium]
MAVSNIGMPDQATWENLFDIKKVFATLKLNGRIQEVVEFGCGYGTFTISAAEIISGTIHAIDSDPEMIRVTSEAVKKHQLENVEVIQRDFVLSGSGMKNLSMDYVMLFNVLNAENQNALFKDAKRVLKKWGYIGVVIWNGDPETPGALEMEAAPSPEQCRIWARAVGLSFELKCELKPYFYGMLFVKGNTLKWKDRQI